MRARNFVAALTALLVISLGSNAFARERGDEGGERGGRDERGGGGRDARGGGGAGRGMQNPRDQQAAPEIVITDGSIYILTGRELVRLDAFTLEEQAKATIPLPEAVVAQAKERLTRMIKRFDKDGDGKVTEDESRFVKRFDTNGDGVFSVDDEMPGSDRMRGPVKLLVKDGAAFVFTSGTLYRFAAETLVLESQKEIVKSKDKKDKRDKKDKKPRKPEDRKPRGDKEDAPEEQPEEGPRPLF